MKPPAERKRSVILAALLSIIPGVGQIYGGYLGRGLAIFTAALLQIGIFALAAASLKNKSLPVAALHSMEYWLLIVWLWNIGDAYRVTAKLKTSIMIPAIIFVLLNVAIGWQVSEIGTQIQQVDVRSGMASARNLTLALFQPDLAQTYEMQTADASLTVAVDGNRAKSDLKPGPLLNLSIAGDQVRATGTRFAQKAEGTIYLHTSGDKQLASFRTNASGGFSADFPVPVSLPGTYWLQAEVKKPLPIRQWKMSPTLFSSLQGMLETVFLAFIGTAISLLISLPFSFLAARNLASQIPGGWALYSITRSAFNILRSIEVMIIAVIMCIIVGIGPLAGALALSIHGIGALGKLYSEAIESIEHGPIEAVMATGANWLQVVRFGAVPQVVPQFISFTMYRWDINVRMATVIGMVGAGGIGNLLINYINSLQWEKAATAIWLVAIVVMVMDHASAVIRERVV